MPTVGSVLRSIWERGWSFIKRAGTVIVASSVVLWFLQGFGWVDGAFGNGGSRAVRRQFTGNDRWSNRSIFAPLGWGDWQSTVATITGLIAKENVVATFGVLFGVCRSCRRTEQRYGEHWQQLMTAVSRILLLGIQPLMRTLLRSYGSDQT